MKQAITSQLLELLEDRISTASEAVKSVMESRDSDEKNSAGDKHETSRAMIEIELEKATAQEARIRQMKADLKRIDLTNVHTRIGVGSLVETSNGLYFLGIAWGAVKINEATVYCISVLSPIGELLKGRIAGDEITFQDKQIAIHKVS
jgi:transcription elongation GreA/GreB family factor